MATLQRCELLHSGQADLPPEQEKKGGVSEALYVSLSGRLRTPAARTTTLGLLGPDSGAIRDTLDHRRASGATENYILAMANCKAVYRLRDLHSFWLTSDKNIPTIINAAMRVPTTSETTQFRLSARGFDPAPFCAAPMPNQKRSLSIERYLAQNPDAAF
jgi:hypothetical protein